MSDHPSSVERALFDELMDLPPQERPGRLDERCGDDLALRARLLRLISTAADAERASDFLGPEHLQGLDRGEDEIAAPTPLPRPFGHFRLIGILGSGGMGLVYEAEQDHPQRLVALKVMRSEMVSRELVRRFRRETDTLARLQHPGIAHVYEAGSVADAALGGALVPYIAMELVRGTTLDAFVGESGGDARSIVALVVAICDAVQHAHERGVIHRDLKPANILVVTGEANRPQPKILDFGIARLVGSESHRPAATVATSTGQILGTVAYMSPEQIGGQSNAVDGRTDVYALGVILFELLTGHLPLDVRSLAIADAARVVRDEEPTRLGTADRRLKGDLETIVAKALEKDADRRYPSASALAADLRRFLADEPIHARPTTRIERVRRFARRNRGLVWGVTSTIVALAIGVLVAVGFAISANAARERAEWTSYRAGIAAANASLVNHDVRSARQHLDSTPERFRGWEWRHLVGRLDRSVASARADLDRSVPKDQAEANLTVWTVIAGSSTTLPREWPAGCAMQALAGPNALGPADGARLRVTDQSRSVELWSVDEPLRPKLVVRRRLPSGATPETLVTFDVAEGCPITVAAVSPDGTKVAAILAEREHGDRCWFRDLSTGRSASIAVQLVPGLAAPIAVTDRGEIALGAGPDGTPILWLPETNAVVRLGDHRGLRAIAISHDGTRVATGSQGAELDLFSIDGTPLKSERRHMEGIQSIRFSPDDTRLVTAAQEGTIGLWAITRAPAGLSLLAMAVGHADEVQAADFSADGKWIVSASHDGTVRAWPTDRGALFGDIDVPRSAFGQIDFDASGHTVVATSFFSISRMWDFAGPVPALVAESPAWSDKERVLGAVACSPDGATVVTIESDGLPRIRARRAAALEETWRGDDEMVEVGYTVDGEALGLLPGETPPLTRLRRLPANTPVKLPLPRCASPGMTSSRDGRLLAVRDTIDERRHLVHVLDAATGTSRQSIPYGVGSGCALAELADGRAVIAVAEVESGGNPDLVRDVLVRDAWSGEPIARLLGHAAHIFSIAFTPDGRRLVTGGRDGVLRVWDTETWDEVVGLAGPGGYLWALRFSPSGDVLMSGGSNGVYRAWRAPPLR